MKLRDVPPLLVQLVHSGPILRARITPWAPTVPSIYCTVPRVCMYVCARVQFCVRTHCEFRQDRILELQSFASGSTKWKVVQQKCEEV